MALSGKLYFYRHYLTLSPKQLSERTKAMSKQQVSKLFDLYNRLLQGAEFGQQPKRGTLGYMHGLIELVAQPSKD